MLTPSRISIRQCRYSQAPPLEGTPAATDSAARQLPSSYLSTSSGPCMCMYIDTASVPRTAYAMPCRLTVLSMRSCASSSSA